MTLANNLDQAVSQFPLLKIRSFLPVQLILWQTPNQLYISVQEKILLKMKSALRKVLVCEVLVLRVKAKWILNFLFKIPSFNVFTGAIMSGQSDGLGI